MNYAPEHLGILPAMLNGKYVEHFPLHMLQLTFIHWMHENSQQLCLKTFILTPEILQIA